MQEITNSKEITLSKAEKLADWLTEKAVTGVYPLSSADELAQEYLIDKSYKTDDARVAALIRWETAKNFSSGFLTGLGGLTTLPVTIPSALCAAWLIQARMTAAIAKIYGHDITEDRVKTMILCVIIGQDMKEILKQAGVKVGKKISSNLINKIPGEVIKKINNAIGFRLLTKSGTTGIINLTKMVPFVGGVIGGVVDASTCRATGALAKKCFKPQPDQEENQRSKPKEKRKHLEN